MTYCHPPLCNVNRPSHSEIQLFKNLNMKIHGQGHVCGQRSRSCLTFKIQTSRLWSRSNPLVTFEAWSSMDMFAFCFVAIGPLLRYRKFRIWPWKFKVKVMAKVKPNGHIWGLGNQSICLLFVSWQYDHFWLRYNKFYIWPWNFKVKVMAKVKPNGHIWALKFNRYVCFLFRGNRTIFGWDIANSIFDLEIQGQGHGQGQTQWSYLSPRVQSIYLLFVSWQSDHFWLRYSKFHIWPWKI